MHYSDRAYQLLQQEPRPEGFSIEEVRSFIHPDDIPLVLASAEKALASDQPTDMEARYRRVDGSYRYVMTRRVVERDEAGEPRRLRRRRSRRDRAGRAAAAGRGAGAPARGGVARRRHRPVDARDDPPETDWNAQTFAIFDRFPPPRVPAFPSG
jgi:hypothetical protein